MSFGVVEHQGPVQIDGGLNELHAYHVVVRRRDSQFADGGKGFRRQGNRLRRRVTALD